MPLANPLLRSLHPPAQADADDRHKHQHGAETELKPSTFRLVVHADSLPTPGPTKKAQSQAGTCFGDIARGHFRLAVVRMVCDACYSDRPVNCERNDAHKRSRVAAKSNHDRALNVRQLVVTSSELMRPSERPSCYNPVTPGRQNAGIIDRVMVPLGCSMTDNRRSMMSRLLTLSVPLAVLRVLGLRAA